MRYLTQTFCHSLVAALVVELLIRVWRIEAPLERMRLRVLALALPVCSFPLFQLLYPARGDVEFRAGFVLLDVGRWLRLPSIGNLTLGSMLFWCFAAISGIFVAQELLPAVQHLLKRRPREVPVVSPVLHPELYAVAKEIAGRYGSPVPALQMVEDEQPFIYFAGLRRYALVFSRSLLTLLDPLELKAVFAHEVAHLVRRENRQNVGLLLLRAAMFYNPVAMLVFHRILQEKEKLCDDWAIAATGLPNHLASGLVKVFRAQEEAGPGPVRSWLADKVDALESHSRRTTIEERIRRILYGQQPTSTSYFWLRVALTTVGTGGLLFFVV